MKCDFIGIGVQKGASTWVFDVLQDHPEVSMSFPKELDFFSLDENFQKGEDWYHSFFDQQGSGDQKKLGEISPSYFHSEDAPKRVHKYNPKMKIIVTLRDPVERAYSNHLHVIRRDISNYGDVKDKTFESALQKFTEMSGGNPQYLNQSRYYTHLKKWYDLFSKENIIVLIKEDIEKDPSKEASRLYDFLEIDGRHESMSLNKRSNVSYAVKYQFFENMLRGASQMAINLGLRKFVRAVKASPLVQKLREKNATHLSDEIPKMKEETKIMLMDEFSEEVINLSKLLELDSLPWKTWEHASKNKK